MRLPLINNAYHHRSKAFTLVEVVVSTAIIGVVFVSLYAGISAGFAVVNLARENLRATQIMVEKMETIRLYTWEQISSNGYIPATFSAPFFPSIVTNSSSGSSTNYTSGAATVEQSGGLIYTGALTIADAPVSSQYSTNMKLIKLSLTWKSGQVERTREMQTLIAKHGLQNYIY
ncbi:MAG: type IV pilus modification PilV family protein [Verrucomicrobiales bacterium]